jgi:protocatechuate 3,4-dioxygenase, alpha subunit
MSGRAKLIPTSSQTVGPYFRIGLDYLVGCAPSFQVDAAKLVTIRGRVLDRDGAPVSDAMLEFWSAGAGERDQGKNSRPAGFPDRFRRAATDVDGNFSAVMPRPRPIPVEDGRMQAPHLLVLVFARGLLRNLISRAYFDDEPGIGSDPVLLAVPVERRHTLIAQRDGNDSFRWDVHLQGAEETVFFAW